MNDKTGKNILYIVIIIIISAIVQLIIQRAMQNDSNSYAKKIYPGTPEQQKAITDGWSSLYHMPQDTPARFALNNIATRNSWRSFNLLRGDWPGTDEDRDKAAAHLKALKKDIDRGLNWPIKTPPSFNIPYCKKAPVLDGNIKDQNWNNALTFNNSYPVDQAKNLSDNSTWKMMWNEKYLYIGASFQDDNIIGPDNKALPYQGDSLEMFIMPSKRIKMYWEVIIGCNSDIFDALHCNNRYGGWASNPAIVMEGLKYKTSKQNGILTIEVALPFSQLPNYMNNNTPKAGETLYFALVRTNKKDKDTNAEYTSAFPLLYGGHNIFGYAKGTLTK